MKRILLELDIEKDQDCFSLFLSQLKIFLRDSFSGIRLGNIEMCESLNAAAADPASHVAHEHSFTVGSLSFTINKPSLHEEFVAKCVKVITDHLDDDNFSVTVLADFLHLSKPTLYRKIKHVTGLSAREFVRNIKMNIAFQMLMTRNYTVSEVAWKCGYTNARHFSKTFYQLFNLYPSKISGTRT